MDVTEVWARESLEHSLTAYLIYCCKTRVDATLDFKTLNST